MAGEQKTGAARKASKPRHRGAGATGRNTPSGNRRAETADRHALPHAQAPSEPRPSGAAPEPRSTGTPSDPRPTGAAPYTAGALAALAGTTVRALHHYEAEGLLSPARDASGYRRYDADQVARLQQVMLLRACGMPLADIRALLDDPAYDQIAAMQRHLATLRTQQEQLNTLVRTVEKTIATLRGDYDMTDTERFEGLKRQAVDDNERAYGTEARERWGDKAVDAANERTLGLTPEEWADREALGETVLDQLRRAFADGAGDPTGPEARALAEMHGRWLTLHWGEGAYSPAAHASLADAYVADARFTRYYDDAAGPGATAFLRDAIAAWCAGR